VGQRCRSAATLLASHFFQESFANQTEMSLEKIWSIFSRFLRFDVRSPSPHPPSVRISNGWKEVWGVCEINGLCGWVFCHQLLEVINPLVAQSWDKDSQFAEITT